MKILQTILFFFLTTSSYSQLKYSVKAIPDTLLKNADAVIRYEENKYIYKSADDIDNEIHIAITILNEKGLSHATYELNYNLHTKINDIEGALYNDIGLKIRSLKNSEITDVASFDGISIATDSRKKVVDFKYAQFPFTVEFIAKVNTKTNFFPFSDYILSSNRISSEYFSVSYNFPTDVKHEIFQLNTNAEIIKEELKNRVTTKLTVQNTKPLSEESYGLPVYRKIQVVYCKMESIKYDQYVGSSKSWKDIGDFILQLNKGRDELPITEVEKIKFLIQSLVTDEEKVKALYGYMQSKTRYVSIQMGIGGHQPFSAQEVSSKGYGDCKALSNYMYSILKVAGIKSNYILINGGRNNNDFPYDKFAAPLFNHAVLAVPLATDTIWLECTSQSEAAGYQGSFTGDRQALWVEEGASKIVNTNNYAYLDNTYNISCELNINDKGSSNLKCNNNISCLPAEGIISRVITMSKEDQEKYLNKSLDIPSYEVVNFNYEVMKSKKPSVIEKMELNLPYYATKQGNRIFVIPNILSKNTTKPKVDSVRISNFYLPTEMREIDTIKINIPPLYKIESSPKDISLKNEFGEFDVKLIRTESQIIYIRRRIHVKGEYDKSKYKDYVKYNDQIFNHDKGRIVFSLK